MLAPNETETIRLVHMAEEEWHTNWKCLVENFMEGYHMSVVHPRTLHSYTPPGLSQKLVNGDGHTSYAANYPDTIQPRGVGAPGPSEAERKRSSLFAKFPTQVASLLVSLSIFPVQASLIRTKWTMSMHQDYLDWDAAQRAEYGALWSLGGKPDLLHSGPFQRKRVCPASPSGSWNTLLPLAKRAASPEHLNA